MSDVFHFIAIGGIGQSALAKILLQKGYEVSGSDISDNKYLKELKGLGAKIFIGHDEKNIPGFTRNNVKIVLSTAIKEDNPELIFARTHNLEILHRSDVLKLISDFYPNFIGFSGTHGKTTTSGLCAYILSKIGVKPGFAIGGIIPEINTNGELGDSPYFVAELDESDGTILKYSPRLTVINNLESDHFDFFENGLEQIFDTFKTYVNNLAQDAKIIINIDDKGNLEFIERYLKPGQFSTFSLHKPATFEARNVELNSRGSSFIAYYEGEKLGEIKLSIPGMHNVYNALAVLAAIIESGFEFSEIQPYFETFSGMGRRFQLVQEFNGIKIIDDYAHHPTEILTTLAAAQKFAVDKSRVVAIFQPHRYTRFKGLWDEFLGAFSDADLLIVLDVYAAGETPEKGFESADFTSQIKHAGRKNALHIKGGIKEAAKEICKLLHTGDIVLTLGAGDITKMGEALYEASCKT